MSSIGQTKNLYYKNRELSPSPFDHFDGKESSGGGGSTIHSEKNTVEVIINQLLTLFKSTNKEQIARILFMPFSNSLNLIGEKQIVEFFEKMNQENFSPQSLTLNSLENDSHDMTFFVTFVNMFYKSKKELNFDLESFIENFDFERLNLNFSNVNLEFVRCSEKYKLETHKLASFMYNSTTSSKALCFDSEELTKIGKNEIRIQLASLFFHELVHIYFEGNKNLKRISDLNVEKMANSLQKIFFNYYSKLERRAQNLATIKGLINQILILSNHACIKDTGDDNKFEEIKKANVFAAYSVTQSLTLLLNNYDLPLDAYFNQQSKESTLLELSQFLNHFPTFRKVSYLLSISDNKKTDKGTSYRNANISDRLYCNKNKKIALPNDNNTSENTEFFNDYVNRVLSSFLAKLAN